MDQQQKCPRFIVREIDREVEHTIHSFNKKSGKIEKKTVKEPYGWHVFFPKSGDSVRIRTQEELERLGFDKEPNDVDVTGLLPPGNAKEQYNQLQQVLDGEL